MINSADSLKDYIKSRLGYPVVEVELDDTQMDYIIDEVIQKFSDYAMSGTTLSYYQLTTIPGVFQYKLDARASSVTDVRFRSNNFSYQFPGGLVITPSDFFASALLPNGKTDLTSVAAVFAQLDAMDSMFSQGIAWDFNDNTKMLTFFEDPTNLGQHALIEVSLGYEPQEIDAIYNHQFIKELCVAKAKYQQGTNVGKYSATLINGASINFEQMKSEALADIERLNTELLTRWTKPLGIYRI